MLQWTLLFKLSFLTIFRQPPTPRPARTLTAATVSVLCFNVYLAAGNFTKYLFISPHMHSNIHSLIYYTQLCVIWIALYQYAMWTLLHILTVLDTYIAMSVRYSYESGSEDQEFSYDKHHFWHAQTFVGSH